jgi:hypothetical protein
MDSSVFHNGHKYCPNGDMGVRSKPASCVRAPKGSVKAIVAPPTAPQKASFCRGNAEGFGGRALWVRRWARLPFLLIPGSTATTGAWPSPLSRGGWLGVQQPDDGPLERSPEMAALQGKSGRVRGSAPFGAVMDSSA